MAVRRARRIGRSRACRTRSPTGPGDAPAGPENHAIAPRCRASRAAARPGARMRARVPIYARTPAHPGLRRTHLPHWLRSCGVVRSVEMLKRRKCHGQDHDCESVAELKQVSQTKAPARTADYAPARAAFFARLVAYMAWSARSSRLARSSASSG